MIPALLPIEIDTILYKKMKNVFILFHENEDPSSIYVMFSEGIVLHLSVPLDTNELMVKSYLINDSKEFMAYLRKNDYLDWNDEDLLRLSDYAYVEKYWIMVNNDSCLTSLQIKFRLIDKKHKPKIRRRRRYYDWYAKFSPEDHLVQFTRNDENIDMLFPTPSSIHREYYVSWPKYF